MAGDHEHHHHDEHEKRQVWVYGLVAPADLLRAQTVVQRVLRSVLGVADSPRHEVALSDAGTLTYCDRERLWRPRGNVNLPPAPRVRQRSEQFFSDLRAALAAAQAELSALSPGLRGALWLPELSPLQLAAVPHPDGRGWDHWLYRLQPVLPGVRGERALPIHGAQAELRLDEGANVISYALHFRPLAERRSRVDLRPFVPPTSHAHAHASKRGAVPRHHLAYVLDGDRLPQLYLAPYYLVESGHHTALLSATSLSLTIDFVVRERAGDTRVSAVVAGGSGRCKFAWAYCSVEDGAGELIELGSQSSRTYEVEGHPALATSTVTLPSGNWNVLVNVLDLGTGAFKHHQELVCSAPRVRSSTTPSLPVV